MQKMAFDALEREDQNLIEALERGSQGERKRLSRHARLDQLQLDNCDFPARFGLDHAKERLLFAAASRRSRRALLRLRAGGRVTWWMIWHNGYSVDRLIAIMHVPHFGRSDDEQYDGESDHPAAESARGMAVLV